MRPIDADEAIWSLLSLKALVELTEIEKAYDMAVDDCISKIKAAPTLDVKPANDAHWIKGMFANITCSNCGFPLCVPDTMVSKLAYCPHCGERISRDGNT